MEKPDGDDEDPFSLDFTKLSLDDDPSITPPEPEPEPLRFDVAAVNEPPAVVVEMPPQVLPESERATPSAFSSFSSPLELVSLEPLPSEPVSEPVVLAPVELPIEAVVPAAAPTPAPVVRPKAMTAPVLLEIARQHAAGKTAEASSALEAALRAGTLGKFTEQGWGMLFDLLQILNRRQAFENLADAYVKRFEKSAPAWLDAAGEVDSSLETGGAAFVALSGELSAASETVLKKLVGIAESNPTVRLGLLKVTDADNDGCRLLLDTLRAIKKCGRECLLSGAEEFATVLASKVEMMQREREETWLLLLELYQRIGEQVPFEDTAIAYAVTFEVSPPSWEIPVAAKAGAPKAAVKGKDPFVLEGELLAGMNSIATLVAAAKDKDAITIETDHLARIDEVSVRLLLDALTPLQAQGLHIRIRGANLLVAILLKAGGLDKIAAIETRRR